MKSNKKNQPFIADALPDTELQRRMFEIGRTIKALRKERMTLDNFAYETKISRSQLSKYEAGGGMLLSTLLKILHGLDITLEVFFRELEKREGYKKN